MTELRVDFCSYEAAKWAVEHWHYSKVMPAGKVVKIGVWESDQFVGCILFSRGGTYTIGDPYGLGQVEVCELTRVALTNHITQTSRIINIAIKILKENSPGLRLIVSYADSKEGHLGIIYQATNWIYVGASFDNYIKVFGQIKHRRSLTSNFGTNSLEWIRAHIDPEAERVNLPPKHKYLYPLNRAMRRQIAPLAKPYPKRESRGLGEIDNASGSNRKTEGASPISPLVIESSNV